MTKAEQKKIERENKQDFLQEVTKIVLGAIGNHLPPRWGKTDIKIRAQGENRYIWFHRYGEDLKIMIYRSGDIDFCFKEFAHADVTIRVVHYDDVPANKEGILDQFRKDAEMVIKAFLDYYWHAFMDYLCHANVENDWRETIELFLEELIREFAAR